MTPCVINNILKSRFVCGFLALGWRQVQYDYLFHIGSKKSSTLWLTKLQCQIWEISWSMWEHRNKHLHNDISSIYWTDYQSIVGEIIKEWNLGVNGLSRQHQHLFHGNIHQRLNENIHLKLMWLASVWAARERLSCSEKLTYGSG